MKKLFILVALIVLVGAGGYWYITAPTPQGAQGTSDQNTQPVVNAQPIQNTPSQDKRIFTSEHGFRFSYPATWRVSGVEPAGTGQPGYRVLARIKMGAKLSAPDTDMPSELVLIRELDVPCKGQKTTFAGESAYDTGWGDPSDFSVLGRNICLERGTAWPLYITVQVLPESQAAVDVMLSSFEFLSHERTPLGS